MIFHSDLSAETLEKKFLIWSCSLYMSYKVKVGQNLVFHFIKHLGRGTYFVLKCSRRKRFCIR